MAKKQAVTMSDAQELADSLPIERTMCEDLNAAQSEMTSAKKDSTNPHFRSNYADLASVQAACMPALLKYGFAVVQMPETLDGKHFLKTVFMHRSGDRLECSLPMLMNKQDMQGYGSAMTYARRYGLMSLAGIAPDDDDGNAASEGAPPQAKPQPKPASEESVNLLVEYALALPHFEGSIEVFNAFVFGICKREISTLSEDSVKKTLDFLKNNQDVSTWRPEWQNELEQAKHALIKY